MGLIALVLGSQLVPPFGPDGFSVLLKGCCLASFRLCALLGILLTSGETNAINDAGRLRGEVLLGLLQRVGLCSTVWLFHTDRSLPDPATGIWTGRAYP